MRFINPIEILNLDDYEFASIDNSVIKKARRKIIAEIELSDDGCYYSHGQEINKFDFDKVADELDDQNKREFYYFIAKNLALNNFLAEADETIFQSFKHESIYQLSEFKNFISPFFSFQYNKSILKAFEDDNITLLREILRTQILISQSDLDTAYRGVSKEIQNRIEEINEIKDNIKNEISVYNEDTIVNIVDLIQTTFPFQTLNSLPTFYFQSLINKVASAINYLQLAVDAKFTSTEVPLELINHVLELNIESVDKLVFENNYAILYKRNLDRIEQERFAPIFKQWVKIIDVIFDLAVKIDSKELHPIRARRLVNETLDVPKLNGLGDFADEIRTRVALGCKGLSVAIWNQYGDIDEAINLIQIAQSVRLDIITNEKIQESLNQLLNLKRQKDNNEKEEIKELITLIEKINLQIKTHGMINMQAGKIKDLLNKLFTPETIKSLSESHHTELRRKLFYELEKTLVKLDAFYTNNLLKRLKPLGNTDGDLAVLIENRVSGLEFKTKNIANNVGTGLGKANDAMQKTLPPQLVGCIYIMIIVMVISFFGYLFNGCH